MLRLLKSVIIISLLFLSCGNNNLPPGGSGLIEASDVIVSAEAIGRLLKMNYGEGDLINIGDTIGVIDTTSLNLRLNQVLAVKQAAETQIQTAQIGVEQAGFNFNLAEKEFTRVSSLIKTGSINQQQYDQAENAYNQANLAKKQAMAGLGAADADLMKVEAEVELLKKSLSDCYPGAPMTGRIIQKYVDAGELVGAGKALVKIAYLDTVWVKIYLPPSDLTRIKLGDKAEVDPEDVQNNPMSGYISWISSEAEFTPKNIQTKEARADLVYAVKIVIPNEDNRLKIGMPVSVAIQ